MSPTAPRYTALRLAEIIGVEPPTEEQQRIIEGPLDTAVVIAGAGSGKTTVIAQRVVYLVANGIVDAESILGLTFTRKAVGELNERIRRLLHRFRAAEGDRRGSTDLPGLDVPTVTTYNSFAAGIVSDHGVRIGVEPESRLLDIADAMELAGTVVDAATDREIPPNVARSAAIDQILGLSSQINEHLQTPEAVIDHLDDCLDAFLTGEAFTAHLDAIRRKRIPKEEKEQLVDEAEALAARAGLGEVPAGRLNRSRGADPARLELIDLLAGLAPDTVLPLVHKRRVAVLSRRYLDLKRAGSAMEFSDQVAFAHRIMTEVPAVRGIERARWSVVMLDEYQDTSDSQFELLRTVFAGLPVMAVGDPRQSIYGWRGASARNIGEFPLHFRSPDGTPARALTLSTSWRNDADVLAVANRLAAALPDADPADALTARPGAGAGRVDISATPGDPDPEYGSDQWAGLAQWLVEIGEEAPARTRAVLCRKRSQFAPVAHALTAAGLDVHIAGSTGMLDDPFVADAHSALQALVDPGAGDHLMRLLSGTVCGLGVSDIAALDRFTRQRSRRLREKLAPAGPEDVGAPGPGGAGDTEPVPEIEDITLVEGIDDLLTTGAQADARATGLSPAALRRITRLAAALRTLRRSTTTIPGLVREVIRELDIDTEVDALPAAAAQAHRASLDAFVSLALDYTAQHPEGTVRTFLDWVTVLESKDALANPESEPDPTAVTVMTIHSSKGLEFDAVAIPDCVVGDLPTGLRETKGWLAPGALPYPLRGDRAKLPSLDLLDRGGSSPAEFTKWLKEDIRPELEDHHLTEERRLAYVAVTRARSRLWLGAALHTTRTKPNEFSPFLHEALEVLGRDPGELPEADDSAEHTSVETVGIPWPVVDTARYDRQRAHLAQLRARRAEHPDLRALAESAADPEVRALAARVIALDEARTAGGAEFAVPARLSTTGIVAFLGDPAGFAASTRRPMPYAPNEATGLGTAFHTWVENYYGQAALGDVDVDPTVAALSGSARQRLSELIEVFTASEFARLEPAEIELPFELVLDRADGTAVHVPGKIDAVFRTAEGLRVVDWKTARAPGEEQLTSMAVQLSVYALALSRMPEYTGIPVDAAFYFLGSDRVVRAPRLLGAAELLAALESGAHHIAQQSEEGQQGREGDGVSGPRGR